MFRRILTYNESFISHNIPQTKNNNFSPQRLAHISGQITAMQKPLISMHQHPDGDAWGSAIAVAGYLKNIGKEPVIVIGEKDKIPAVFKELIKKAEITVLQNMPQEYDGIILVDTPCVNNTIINIKTLTEDTPIIDIDHHEGEGFIGKEDNTLVSNQVASTTELLFHVLNKKEFSPEIAEALLLGIISDTRNLAFLKTPFTKTIINTLYQMISPQEKAKTLTEYLNDKFLELIELSKHDEQLISTLIKELTSASFDTLQSHGKKYIMRKVFVPNGPEENNKIIPDDITGLRKQLAEELGFKSNADIIMIVYYDPQKDQYRVSLSRYNKALENDLDLRVLVAQFGGGGQRGAVGFDLKNEQTEQEEDLKKQMARIVSDIKKSG